MAFPKNPDGSYSGKLKSSEKAKVIEALKEKHVTGPCELCRNTSWSLQDSIVAPLLLLRTDSGLSVGLSGDAHPAVMLLCTNCGNTKLLNIGILGLAKYLDQPDNKDE